MKKIEEGLVDSGLLGIPYKLGGKDRSGIDCIGVTVLWLKSQGIDFEYDDRQGPVLANWWERNPRRFMDAILEIGTIVRFNELRKFDCLMLIGNEQAVFPSCLGVMVDDRHMLTATEERGTFVEMLNLYWKSRFWGAVRLRKVVEMGL